MPKTEAMPSKLKQNLTEKPKDIGEGRRVVYAPTKPVAQQELNETLASTYEGVFDDIENIEGVQVVTTPKANLSHSKKRRTHRQKKTPPRTIT